MNKILRSFHKSQSETTIAGFYCHQTVSYWVDNAKFQKFDGRKRNISACFINSMWPFAHKWSSASESSQNHWPIVHILGILTWNQDLSKIESTSNSVQHKILLWRGKVYIGRVGLDLYTKSFHDKALDYCNSVDEDTMVDVCLHGMANEYRVFFWRISCSSPSIKLMEAVKRTNESVQRTLDRPSVSTIIPTQHQGHFLERGRYWS